MTRESKIGLIVAGSFVCLVCIVVASKLRHGDDPSEEQTIQVAAAKPTQNTNMPEPKKKETPAKVEPTPRPESKVVTPTKPNPTFPAIPELKLPPSVVPPPVVGNQVELPQPKSDFVLPAPPGGFDLPKPNGQEPKPLALPAPVPMPPLNLTPEIEKNKPVAPVEAFGSNQIPAPKPLAPIVEEKKSLTFPEPQKPVELKPAEVAPPLIAPPILAPMNPELPPAPTPMPMPFTNKDQPPSLTPVAPRENPIVPPLSPPTPLPKDGTPSVPTFTIPKETPTPPPIIDTTPRPLPTIPPNNLSSTPPISLPGSGNKPLPTVKDSSVDLYRCQPGDANFAIVSQRLYGTDKYADALLAYNRAHSKMVDNGTAFYVATPSLTPGQQVIHPPANVLDRDFRSFIRESNVSTVPTIPSAQTPPAVNLTRPLPLTPSIATISNPPNGGQVRSYRVQNPGGESILDIAERVLGNRSQWTEIYRINQANPAVRPPALIPANTELKMPG